jgi:DNA-directed RNA polymerase specialized sigma24 family protein
VSRAKRELLLRVHRHRLRREDLEDCYSQATLELLGRARAGASFANRSHLANTLEQRFLSRVHDRRRALSGRSPMQAAFETATPLGSPQDTSIEIVDLRADTEELTILRHELRRVVSLARALTPDQRLVLASQVGTRMGCEEFCRRHGWSPDKYHKVAQRARARLRLLMSADERDVPSAPPESDQTAGTRYDHLSPHS